MVRQVSAEAPGVGFFDGRRVKLRRRTKRTDGHARPRSTHVESARLGGRAANDEAVSTVRKAVRQGLLVDAGLGSCGNRRGAGASSTPPRLSLSEAAADRGARGNLSPCAPPASPSESNQYFALSARARDAGDAPRSGKFSKTPERPGRLARATTGAKYPSRGPLRWKAAGRNAPCFPRRAPRITNSCMSPAPEANTGTLPFRPHRRTRNRRNSQNAKTQPFGGSPPPDGGARIDL